MTKFRGKHGRLENSIGPKKFNAVISVIRIPHLRISRGILRQTAYGAHEREGERGHC